ncbi:metallophosphoesterase [Amaricoccus solimangrovi]|uniref:Serine/threonine protein phosphatase n=1 Tax=Amaricoccus solimangrovi TaxID=2589815 RepID=A0A501WHF5_9RHOB|nr:metallophosphoesterase [Amaricoccus solimangrovi]TPE48788.1 serine/threonine protein phosphatase [Amaricoccus solimangrovi]
MSDLTAGHRIYAIGDIHGHLSLLDAMIARIRADLDRRPHPAPVVIFLGDFCDRGPDTRGVYRRLIELQRTGFPFRFLLGNHDSYIPAYLRDPEWYDRTYHWLNPAMGGDKTLASYGVTDASDLDPAATRAAFARALPAAHLRFIETCELWIRIGGYVFAHAGIRPGVPMARQDRDDLIWIRQGFLDYRKPFGFKVVHGHTIVPQVEHHPNRIAVDTGAFRTGNLSCVVLEGADVSLLRADGPFPWPEGSGLPAPSGLAALRNNLRTFWPSR